MTNFWALNTLSSYLNISKIIVLIQITLCRNARIRMVYQRTTVSQQRKQKIILLALRKEKRYLYVKCLNSLVFVLLHASNFVMETEDNSIQRQLYESSIIWVGATLLIRNDFHIHKELHHRWSGGWRSTSGLLLLKKIKKIYSSVTKWKSAK